MTESVGVVGWGVARLPLGEIAALRRELPSWSSPDISGHFFKHADEQTIVAVRAVSHALERHDLAVADQRGWGVVACPRFAGRIASANTLARFRRGGVPLLSPHTVPQHSLHSISGAVSILLGAHGPNVGVGGGPRAWEDGLLAGLSLFAGSDLPGCWLIATEWSPEPLPDAEGNWPAGAVCSALALAIQPSVAGAECGRLRLNLDSAAYERTNTRGDQSPVTDLVTQLAAQNGCQRGCLGGGVRSWRLSWGATISLEPATQRAGLRAAA